jgi:hypothetical protein
MSFVCDSELKEDGTFVWLLKKIILMVLFKDNAKEAFKELW